MNYQKVELHRQSLQSQLDSTKTHEERNKLGQFSTPLPIAMDILQYSANLLGQEPIRFLDPALGTGAFFSAFIQTFPKSQIVSSVGYEIDSHYGNAAADIWAKHNLQIHFSDFTRATPPASENLKPNLIICNPPYVRHHHLSKKTKQFLANRVFQSTNLPLSGLAGLYCYFMLICHEWMSEGGIAGWLIPSEFMDVNYGVEVKNYLVNKVKLIRIHRFDPNELQFDDALVSSAVVWFQKTKTPPNHKVEFTYGGTLKKPKTTRFISISELEQSHKWTQLTNQNYVSQRNPSVTISDLFEIKRGIATGANKFFILPQEKLLALNIPAECAKPILPSPKHVPDEIMSDESELPILSHRLFLLDCNLPPSLLEEQHPQLWQYYLGGIEQGIDQKYLCSNRTPWYSQEQRDPAPILCTYMGRNRGNSIPFRFIFNHSKAIASNVYLLLYPKPILKEVLAIKHELLRDLWDVLRNIPIETIVNEGRVYGGGLHKVEPKELANIPLMKSSILRRIPNLQYRLF
ncbi:MAG: N-6 DNA methylase [Anaerolineae bacterium]|nr:N-6 DNA methylase [Anaerolineae bacterium]